MLKKVKGYKQVELGGLKDKQIYSTKDFWVIWWLVYKNQSSANTTDKWRTKARNNREWIKISNRDKNTLTWQHRH